jgi:hypothetical protein
MTRAEFMPRRLDTLLVTVQRQAVGSLPTASGARPILGGNPDIIVAIAQAEAEAEADDDESEDED